MYNSSSINAVYDVLVVGSGIAGTTAALTAAEAGARVALASSGPIFSGSSFFDGTWGLGLVGPDRSADEADFIATIERVGRGMALHPLVEVLIKGINPAIEKLEARGCKLKRAEKPEERDFIPCFDYKCRSWHGLGRAEYRACMSDALEQAGVEFLPYHDLLDIEDDDFHICGAQLFDQKHGVIVRPRTRSIVFATGGFGGLFARTLTQPDVLSTAQAIALNHGAALINAEFIQIMPGLLSPVSNVVFNERTFKYAQTGCFELAGLKDTAIRSLLEARAAHGPFSASLPDRAIDFAIAQADGDGLAVTYDLPPELPEFMQTYFDWFSSTYGKNPAQDIRIAPYAHASNGGILIDTHARTGVDGLFACGECTGGMHGADRIGGLSSANALVFGEIAGREAAAYAAAHPFAAAPGLSGMSVNTLTNASPRAVEILEQVHQIMSADCLIVRTAENLLRAQTELENLERELTQSAAQAQSAAKDVFQDNAEWGVQKVVTAQARTRGFNVAAAGSADKPSSPVALAQTIQTQHAILSAKALVAAMLARTESRGSHYRQDCPQENISQTIPHIVTLNGGTNVQVHPYIA